MTRVKPGEGAKALANLAARNAAQAIAAKLTAGVPKFDPGRMVMTPGAVSVLANNNALVSEYLIRHITGDWGKLDLVDCQSNNVALKDGTRLLSSYTLGNGEQIWIITDAVDAEAGGDPLKREVTTVLLPEEY
jgi:hypothetical protein